MPEENHTPAQDATVVALVRAGVDTDTIYETLWPDQDRRPVPRSAFAAVVQALEVADATAAPPEELPPDLEAVVDDLLVARRRIMRAIEGGCDLDEEGGFDNQAHVALVKNAEAVLKFQASRQERQVHRLNLRVAREKARLEVLALYGKESN